MSFRNDAVDALTWLVMSTTRALCRSNMVDVSYAAQTSSDLYHRRTEVPISVCAHLVIHGIVLYPGRGESSRIASWLRNFGIVFQAAGDPVLEIRTRIRVQRHEPIELVASGTPKYDPSEHLLSHIWPPHRHGHRETQPS